MNIVGIVGRLTSDPESKSTEKTEISKFTVAVDRAGDYNQEEKKPAAGFFSVVAFGQPAKFMNEFGKKGSRVGITGELSQHRWTTESGESRSIVEIRATNCQLLESKTEAGTGESQPEPAEEVTSTQSSSELDELLV